MQLEKGSIVDGKVTGITKFGAFVDVGEGKTGLVHISEVSSTFVKEVSDYLKEGQEVKVKILNVSEDGKIALSIRQAMEPNNKSGRTSNTEYPRKKNDYTKRNNFNRFAEEKKEQQSLSFEDMMAKFKKVSDEKLSAISGGADSGRVRPRRNSKNR